MLKWTFEMIVQHGYHIENFEKVIYIIYGNMSLIVQSSQNVTYF